MRIWASIAFVCLAAAIWQWLELADRIRHLAWFAFKFGIEPHLISAGSFMVVVFFGATALFVGLGLVASRQLRGADSRLRFCSRLSVQMLIAGAVVWGGLLVSPLIQIVSR
jgi:hypothetical protein